MSAVTRLLGHLRGWLADRRAFKDFEATSGEWMTDLRTPAPGERVRGRAYQRLVAWGDRRPRAVRRRLPK